MSYHLGSGGGIEKEQEYEALIGSAAAQDFVLHLQRLGVQQGRVVVMIDDVKYEVSARPTFTPII